MLLWPGDLAVVGFDVDIGVYPRMSQGLGFLMMSIDEGKRRSRFSRYLIHRTSGGYTL